MQNAQTKTDSKPKIDEFRRRLDFYWQFIAVYSIALIIYGFLKGSIDEGTLTITVKDPVVILLLLFLIITGIGLLINWYKKTTIIVGKEYIIFKSRYKEKKYGQAEISRISMGKERVLNLKSSFRFIKIRIIGRRKVIRIRPTSFENENALMHDIISLKKNLNK